MQAFMQSLQMRWPVAAHIGLSTTTMASAPIVWPPTSTKFISEIFSSSGHPPVRARLELAALLFEPLRAGVLALVVAPDAVVGVIERAGEIGAGIGERETVARAAMCGRQLEHRHAIDDFGLDRNQMVRIDL